MLAGRRSPGAPHAHSQQTELAWVKDIGVMVRRPARRGGPHLLIRPGGNVEFIGPELRKLSRPDRCDEMAFFMNAAINGVAKNGFEVTAVFDDDVVMRRAAGR